MREINMETLNKIKDTEKKIFQDYLHYVIIAILSCISLFVFPFIGSALDVGLSLPNTSAGWLVFIVSKLSVAILNVVIFHSFIKQAKINVRSDPNYKKALEILSLHSSKIYVPRSLKQFNKTEYSSKMITIFFTSILSAFSLSQAVLAFDVTTFLSYAVTVTFGVIFGVFEMQKYEDYYVNEFLDYANYITRKEEIDGYNQQEQIQNS